MATGEEEGKRPRFGGRFLTDDSNVFQHNAWDNVSWDEEQEAEAKLKVANNTKTKLSELEQKKYDEEAASFWDGFYLQHQNRFFKDRHWLFVEFPELATTQIMPSSQTKCISCGDEASAKHQHSPESCSAGVSCDGSMLNSSAGSVDLSDSDVGSTQEQTHPQHGILARQNGPDLEELYPGSLATFRIFEVGCGVGNTVLPVLRTNRSPGLFVYGCDLSSNAIEILKEQSDFASTRCHVFTCDVTDPACKMPFPEQSLDIIVMIFILSAISPKKFQFTINRLASHLKPGGSIVFRDYGRYDMAQLRFKDGQCLEDNFYVRGDGTRVYFFTQEELRELFTKAGLVEVQNIVDRRLQVNRGRQLKMYRVWIQCKYRKPLDAT